MRDMYLNDKLLVESRTSKDGDVTCTKSVYKADNGYVLIKEEKTDSKDGPYIEPTLTLYISKENPFALKEKKEETTKDLMEMFVDKY